MPVKKILGWRTLRVNILTRYNIVCKHHHYICSCLSGHTCDMQQQKAHSSCTSQGDAQRIGSGGRTCCSKGAMPGTKRSAENSMVPSTLKCVCARGSRNSRKVVVKKVLYSSWPTCAAHGFISSCDQLLRCKHSLSRSSSIAQQSKLSCRADFLQPQYVTFQNLHRTCGRASTMTAACRCASRARF